MYIILVPLLPKYILTLNNDVFLAGETQRWRFCPRLTGHELALLCDLQILPHHQR